MSKEKTEKKISKKISEKLRETRKKAQAEENIKDSEKNLLEKGTLNEFKSFSEENQIKENLKDELKQVLKKNKEELKHQGKKTFPHFLKEKTNKQKKTSDPANKELSVLNEKLQRALKDNLYLRAEFENAKRQFSEERSQLIRYSGERFIFSLANEVLDDLERAIFSAQTEKSFENLTKGLEMIQKKLSQVLDSFGVEILDPIGKIFDPSYQEALSYVTDSEIPDGHVVKTFKKAYKLHDKIIRPAQVVLAKKEKEKES